MKLLNKLFARKINNEFWEDIKSSGSVYPPELISVFQFSNHSGKFGTGWVNKAYKNYSYKKFCPFNFLIMIDLTDSIASKNPNLDMGTIEEYFITELRKVSISHIVARIVTEIGLNIELYLEMEEPGMKHLYEILKNPNRLVSFNCEVNYDPEWAAVKGLMI